MNRMLYTKDRVNVLLLTGEVEEQIDKTVAEK